MFHVKPVSLRFRFHVKHPPPQIRGGGVDIFGARAPVRSQRLFAAKVQIK